MQYDERIMKAWPMKREVDVVVDGHFTGSTQDQYQVWYHTDKGLENMFVTYLGEPSARDWHLNRCIALAIQHAGDLSKQDDEQPPE